MRTQLTVTIINIVTDLADLFQRIFTPRLEPVTQHDFQLPVAPSTGEDVFCFAVFALNVKVNTTQ